MKNIYFLLVAFMVTSLSFGQTTLKFQDFESGADDWTYTESPTTYSVGSDVWAIVATLGGTVTAPQNGANFWGMRDLANANGGTATGVASTLAFPNVDIAGQVGVEVSFQYITDAFDGTDSLQVEVFFDDASQGVTDLGKNTDAWTGYSLSVPDAINNVRLTIIAIQNGGSDYAGVDNFKVQSGVAASCGFSYGANTATCQTFTGGVDTSDTYDITIAYSGGSAGLVVTATAGTIAGDDPATTPSGTIQINGVTEGTDVDVTVADGGLCNEMTTINSPNNCVAPLSFPIEETFPQTVGSTLASDSYWDVTNTSGDSVLLTSGNLSIMGLRPSLGNSASFDGAGNDPFITFPVATGTIYSSFIFKITDISSATNASGGYFAVLGSFDARVWVKEDAAQFVIGVSNGSSGVVYTTTKYDINTDIFIVFNYDTATGVINFWVNPDSATFSATEPAVTATVTDASVSANISQFLFRQDSTSETGFIVVDELRISDNWADVTPTAPLSIADNTIAGFSIYPNPATNNITITTRLNQVKAVEIFTILGKKVMSTRVKNTLNVSQLSTGVYIVKVTENKVTATKKLIIK